MHILTICSMICFLGILHPFKPFKNRWVAFISFVLSSLIMGAINENKKSQQTYISKEKPTEVSIEKSMENTDLQNKKWVKIERLNRRTCPSLKCGITGQLFLGDTVEILEERNGWVRITKFYDAFCMNNKSDFIDEGNNNCSIQNGVLDGKFAEWVSSEHLSEERPLNYVEKNDANLKALPVPTDITDKEYETTDVKETLWIIKGKDAVKEILKDPDSAEFRNVYFHRGVDNIPMTCGEINSKNAFGGYSGFQRFISAGKQELTFLEYEVKSFQEVWDRFCR